MTSTEIITEVESALHNEREQVVEMEVTSCIVKTTPNKTSRNFGGVILKSKKEQGKHN